MKAFVASLAACVVLAVAGAGVLALWEKSYRQEQRTADSVRR